MLSGLGGRHKTTDVRLQAETKKNKHGVCGPPKPMDL